jgi:hypothetical protein
VDVAALAADDAAFHVVGGDRHRADGVVGRLLGGITLDRLQDDLPALILRLVLSGLGDALDQRAGFELAFVLDALQQHFTGLLGGKIGDLQQAVALFLENDVELAFLAFEGFFTLGEAGFQVVQVLFLDGQGVELAIELVLAFFEAAFVIFKVGSGGVDFAIDGVLAADLLLPGGKLVLAGLGLRFAERGVFQPFAFDARPRQGVFAQGGHDRQGDHSAHDQSDDRSK